MKLLAVPMTAAIMLVGCSSAAAPEADNVLNQTEKAKQVGDIADQHNAEIEEATNP